MTEFLLAAGTAFWLGILTSISPCPLATNIAAISYIGRRVDNARQVLLAGLLYTVGRVVAYVGLAFVLVSTALSVIGFAVLIAVGSRKLGEAFHAVSRTERWARIGTGSVILAVGCYLTIQSLL